MGTQGQQQTPARSQGGVVNRPVVQTPSSQFEQRSSGATAGVSASGGQSVFSSSTPAKAKGKKAASNEASGNAPSTRSATGDLWNGFEPSARSSVFAAEASSAGQGQGAGAPLAGLALGFGLAGIAGAALLLGMRRRRAHASAAGSDNTER